jgi:hypothetical protein
MRSSCRYAFLVSAALLAGCGGSQPTIGAPGVASDAAAGKGQSLLYVSAWQNYVYMVALPSGRLVGKLTGLDGPSGVCTDQSGNVFVSNSGQAQIRAYAHGGRSAFRVLNDSSWDPNGCSVDPTTGNLAVCNLRTGQTDGTIAVYLRAKGAAHFYKYSGINNFWYCAYDGDGNLFADAVDYSSDNPIFLLELPKGRGKLQTVSLSPSITGSVIPPLFWYGKHLAIASPSSGAIDEYQISGSTGTRVGVVKLDDASEVTGPFWITSDGVKQNLYAPILENSIPSVGVYSYPAGGKRLQNLYDAPLPYAAAVSIPE